MTPPSDAATLDALRELGTTGAPLTIGGVPADRLAAEFGTPLYVFDADVLRRRVAAVRAALGPRVALLWSVKANPSLAVAHCLRGAGAGAEIASLGELHVALAAGYRAADLRFAGPRKTDHELAQAIAAGLGCFHVESASEVRSLAALSQERRLVTRVAMRVNFTDELSGSRMRMGGAGSRFGVDEAEGATLLRTIRQSRGLHPVGVHSYAGTQCFDAAAFVAHCQRLAAATRRWEDESGLLPEVDVGGGFGVPAFAGDPTFDLAAAGAGLQGIVRAHDRADRTWFVELGRYLAAPAGVYLTRVVRTKASRDVQHAIVDGGMHQHASAAGVGTILRRAPLLVRADDPAARGAPVTVGGPLCTPADQFGEHLPVGPLRDGDLVAILNAGAYGLSFSPHSFLSHPTPAEVLVDGGRPRLVRERGAATDALRGQRI